MPAILTWSRPRELIEQNQTNEKILLTVARAVLPSSPVKGVKTL